MEVLDLPICRYAQDLSRQLRSHALAVRLQSGGFKLRQTYPFLDILSLGCDARVLNRYYRTTVISQCHEHAGRRFPWIACSAAEGHPLSSHLLLWSVDKGQHARRASAPVYQRYAFGYTHLNHSFYTCSSSSRSIIRIRHLLRDAPLIILGMLGKKLGEGAFCAVYKVSPTNKVAAKDGALVLKRATEYGAVEIWVNERVWRACPNSCADFVYGFLEGDSKKSDD